MAIIGASNPYYAIYNANGGNPTYSNGGRMGALVEFNFELESTDNNNFYADNKVQESQRRFSNGTVTIQTDDLGPEVSAAINGLTPSALGTIDGVTDTDVQELVWGEAQDSPYLGIGVIQKKMKNNAILWRAIILTKIIFNIPNEAATTEGEEIDWQVPEITGSIMRDDSAQHNWKREATFTTEAQADAYIRNRLNIPAATPAAATT